MLTKKSPPPNWNGRSLKPAWCRLDNLFATVTLYVQSAAARARLQAAKVRAAWTSPSGDELVTQFIPKSGLYHDVTQVQTFVDHHAITF